MKIWHKLLQFFCSSTCAIIVLLNAMVILHHSFQPFDVTLQQPGYYFGISEPENKIKSSYSKELWVQNCSATDVVITWTNFTCAYSRIFFF